MSKTAGGIEVRFDAEKTYVRFDIVFADDVPVQTNIGLTPLTRFRDVAHPAYREPPAGVGADTFNSHTNNGSASGEFQLDGETVPAATTTAGAAVVVKKFSEWLDLQAPENFYGKNNSLATMGGGYSHAVILSANIDDSKDWSSARLIVLLPSSFTPNGVTDLRQDKDGLSCIDGPGGNGGQDAGHLIRSISYRHNYADGRNALIVRLNPDSLAKMQTPERHDGYRKQSWLYVNGSINNNTLEGNTGTFDDYFTSDAAPAQSGEGTVPDAHRFGPNANIVHSSFSYMLVKESSPRIPVLRQERLRLRKRQHGRGIGITPGKEFYYRLLLVNTRGDDSGKITFVDGLPAVGDKTPQGGEPREMDDGRKTRFPVRLSGPITARMGTASGAAGSGAAADVTLEYTTDTNVSSLTMSEMSSLTWRPASDFGTAVGKTPWTDVTGFRAVCQNIPSNNALMLIVPAIVRESDANVPFPKPFAQSGVPTDQQKTEFGLVDTRDGGISDHRVVAVNMAGRELNGSGSGSGTETGAGRIKQSNPAAVSLTRGGFVIRKTDASDTDRNLAGASFTLTGSGETSGVNLSATTDATGTATFLGLPDGTYTLTETRSPSGYLRASAPMTVRVEHKPEPQQGVEGSTEESVSVTMTGDVSGKGTAADPYLIADQQAPTSLPKAGGTGVAMVLTTVAALIALGLLAALLLVRTASRARHPCD